MEDAELDRLYRKSCGLLVLSDTEGFGMPLLEAARRGCPVLALISPPLREVLGDAAFWFREPASLSDFAAFLNPLERSHRSRQASLRARDFSWQTTAQNTLAAYRSVLRRSQRRG